jgi:predicted naringenin-chalcone synthase
MDDLYNMPIPESEPKKTVIQGFATGTPKYAAKQKDIFFDLIMKLKDGGLSEDKLTKLMVNTTVDKRHLAFPPHEYIESCLSPKRRKNIIKEVGGDLATSVAR